MTGQTVVVCSPPLQHLCTCPCRGGQPQPQAPAPERPCCFRHFLRNQQQQQRVQPQVQPQQQVLTQQPALPVAQPQQTDQQPAAFTVYVQQPAPAQTLPPATYAVYGHRGHCVRTVVQPIIYVTPQAVAPASATPLRARELDSDFTADVPPREKRLVHAETQMTPRPPRVFSEDAGSVLSEAFGAAAEDPSRRARYYEESLRPRRASGAAMATAPVAADGAWAAIAESFQAAAAAVRELSEHVAGVPLSEHRRAALAPRQRQQYLHAYRRPEGTPPRPGGGSFYRPSLSPAGSEGTARDRRMSASPPVRPVSAGAAEGREGGRPEPPDARGASGASGAPGLPLTPPLSSAAGLEARESELRSAAAAAVPAATPGRAQPAYRLGGQLANRREGESVATLPLRSAQATLGAAPPQAPPAPSPRPREQRPLPVAPQSHPRTVPLAPEASTNYRFLPPPAPRAPPAPGAASGPPPGRRASLPAGGGVFYRMDPSGARFRAAPPAREIPGCLLGCGILGSGT